MARLLRVIDASGMTEPVITREEVVALLFNVADVAASADGIESLLRGEEDDGEAETDEG